MKAVLIQLSGGRTVVSTLYSLDDTDIVLYDPAIYVIDSTNNAEFRKYFPGNISNMISINRNQIEAISWAVDPVLFEQYTKWLIACGY